MNKAEVWLLYPFLSASHCTFHRDGEGGVGRKRPGRRSRRREKIPWCQRKRAVVDREEEREREREIRGKKDVGSRRKSWLEGLMEDLSSISG